MKRGFASPGKAARVGFTLLEVLLTLLISALVMAAIGMAIHFHLHLLDSGRNEVEDAQLARALLRRMADDLRCTVRYQAPDASSTASSSTESGNSSGGSSSSSASTPSSQGTGGGQPSSGSGSQGTGSSNQKSGQGSAASGNSGTGSGGVTKVSALTAISALSKQSAPSGSNSQSKSSGSSSGNQTSSETSSTEETTTVTVPGLYGNANELQIDVSRLPRIEQHDLPAGTNASAVAMDRMSEIKTVAYYVVNNLTMAGSGSGLVTREFDRAASSYATNLGNSDLLNGQTKVLAPEVLAVEFRYYDGIQWLTEWDSTAAGCLPVAVEIALTLIPSHSRAAQQTGSLIGESAVYRLLVPLQVDSSTSSGSSATGTSTTTQAAQQ